MGQSFWRKDGRKIPHVGPGAGTSGPWEPLGHFRPRTVGTAPDIQEDCAARSQGFRQDTFVVPIGSSDPFFSRKGLKHKQGSETGIIQEAWSPVQAMIKTKTKQSGEL